MESKNVSDFDNLCKEINIEKNCYYPFKDINGIENIQLKNTFQNASKNKSGNFGKPDRIIITDNNELIIIEVKEKDLIKAEKEVKWYCENLSSNPYNKIFGCAFVNNNINSIIEYKELLKKVRQKNTNTTYIKQELTLIDFLNLHCVKNKIKKCNDNFKVMNKDISAIHNYIRNETKISSEDKPFFVSALFIALKERGFTKFIKDDYTKDFTELLFVYLKKYNLSTTYFKFIKDSLDNDKIYIIAGMILDIYNKNPNVDLLNLFYTEFVKYQNSDSKSLGIVLTPESHVNLMIEILNINKNDIFMDLCSGSGSFPVESLKKNPKQIIGCEFQIKLYILLKTNMIIRNVDNYQVLHNDCFKIDFKKYKITKSAINPPYGETINKELKFIIKQLDSIEENGIITAIIPIGTLNHNKNNQILKKKIMEIGIIKCIIRCRADLFKDSGISVETCIIVIEKNQKGHGDNKTNLLDYRDDGLISEIRKGLSKGPEYEQKFKNLINDYNCNKNLIKLKLNSDWTDFGDKIEKYIHYNDLELYYLDRKYNEDKNKINCMKELIIYKREKDFKLNDIFYILKKPRNKYNQKKNVNNICASKINLGIKGTVLSNEKTFTGNKIVLITGGNGGAGLAHYHIDDFNISSSTIVLEPKYSFLNKNNGIMFSLILSKFKTKYSYGKQWNQEKIKNDIITLPVLLDDTIDYKFLEEQQENMKKIYN